MRRLETGLVALLCALPATASADPGVPTTIGVLGDSYSDEYQFYRPDRSTSRNWVEILSATRGVSFGGFSTQSRGEPRNQGYEYNWARSDATTDDLLASGQHTGLAAQVASGAVSYVVIFIGGNDFIHALESPEPAASLERVLPRALANYRVVLETILGASPEVKVVAVTVPDIRDLPQFQRASRGGRLPRVVLDRCSKALARYNAQIRALAIGQRRIAVADFDLTANLANRISRRHAFIAGRRLDRVRGADDFEHLFLADDRHLGTIGQGLMAQLVVNAMDVKFGAGIAPLTDQDIFAVARSVGADPQARAALTNLATKPSGGSGQPSGSSAN